MLDLKDCQLRSIQETDLEIVLKWRNSDRIRSVMFNDRIISMDEHRAWYEKIRQDEGIHCFIFEVRGKPAGVVTITSTDSIHNRCNWGFYLGENELPCGTGKIMGYLALKLVFEYLKYYTLYGEVLVSNTKSIQYHKKLGFVEEEPLKKQVFKNGMPQDVVVLSMFREDWAKNQQMIRNILVNRGNVE